MLRKNLKRLGCLTAVILLVLLPFMGRYAQAVDSSSGGQPAWANPSAMTIKGTGVLDPGFLSPSPFAGNFDCAIMRLPVDDAGDTSNHCWTDSAFGFYDLDGGAMLFANTHSRVLPIVPFNPSQTIIPWPRSIAALSITSSPFGGSNVNFYTDVLGSLRTDFDATGLHAVDKHITQPPDFQLRDENGQLTINPNALSFSSDGSWMVAETMSGRFVRINLATLVETAFAPSFIRVGGAPASGESDLAISNDGRYVAIGNRSQSAFDVYDLSSCGPPVGGVPYQNCPVHNYWSFGASQIEGMVNVGHLRFINNGLLSFQSTVDGEVHAYELAPAASITSLIDYLGMGDSYSSGEGAYDYELGTDGDDDVCHLSLNSYPLLLSRDAFTVAGGRSVACSGAKINDITPPNPSMYPGQVANGVALSKRSSDQVAQILGDYTPGYLPQENFVAQYQPAALTLTIGGNDIGFSDIIQTCAEPHISLRISDQTCFNTYEDRLEILNRINDTVPRWTNLYHHLASTDPVGHVYAIGYPEIAVDNGDCADNVHLDKSELEFADELVQYLNGAIKQAASAAGVNYVDISQALAGHRLCETKSFDVAVNGLTEGKGYDILGKPLLAKESFHPNALGHELIEQAILQATHNMSLNLPVAVDGDNDSQTLLNVPKSGRPVVSSAIDDSITADSAAHGDTIGIHVDGPSNSLVSGNTYTVHLGGGNGTVLGTLTGGVDGSLSGTVTIPVGGDSGGQNIDITGQGQTGDPVDVGKPIFIPVFSSDTDGDGVPNETDSCPSVPNSGHDADQDGIDDACDPLIGSPPSSGGTAPPNGESPTSGSDTNTQNKSDSGSGTTSGTGQGSNTSNAGAEDAGGSSPVATDPATNSGNPTNATGADNSSGDVELLNQPILRVAGQLSTAHIDFDTTIPSAGSPGDSPTTLATVLGAKTDNPNRLAKPYVPLKHSVAEKQSPYIKLPIFINWLPWVGLISINLLLLLLISFLLERRLEYT